MLNPIAKKESGRSLSPNRSLPPGKVEVVVMEQALGFPPPPLCWTVSPTEILCTSEPDVPVTVKFELPTVALVVAVRVRVELPLPETELGENPAVTPEGNVLVTVRSTVPVNPPMAETVTVPVVCEPCITVMLDGPDKEKSGPPPP